MVAQLVKNELGVYEYVEVDTKPKSNVSSMEAFEAYEGQKKKTELVSAPSIGEQTEKVIRETPGLNRTEFDESTGQFVTRSTIPGKEITYTPGEVTPESTEPTALQKVMKMTEGRTVAEPDYKKIISDAARASRPTWKEQAISSAFDVGGKVLTNYITKKMTGSAGDLAINYMTQNVLGKTLSGRLASGMSGTMISNPYVATAGLLMDTGIGKKVTKGVTKTVKKAADTVVDVVTGGKVVCTAMYQTTQLPEWKKHIKVWQIFERKYLTPYHEIGYHILFKPFAKGMLKNNILKTIGAHIAKHRTQDLKSILFNSKKDLLGRIYRLILEPICYIVGRIKLWQ
jgi:hypothetical protein